MDEISIGPVPIEQRALACLVGIIGGLLILRAAVQSVDRALLVLLLTCALSGIVLGGRRVRLTGSILGSSLLVAVLFSITAITYLAVRILAGALADVQIPLFSGISLRREALLTDTNQLVLLAFAVVLFVAAFIITSVSAFASRPLLAGVAKLFAVGPEAVERANKIIIALTATVAALFALWLAFG